MNAPSAPSGARHSLPRRAFDRVRGRSGAILRRLDPRRLGPWWRLVHSVIGGSLARRREKRLTVAVDITPLWESLSGIGWYLDCLLRELSAFPDVRFRLYGPTVVVTDDIPGPVVEIPIAENVEWVHATPSPGVLFGSPTVRLLRRLQPLWIALDGNRVVFAPNFFLPRRMRWARGALVATIHDLGSRIVPETLAEATRTNLERELAPVLARAAALITPSEAVRSELIAQGVAADRVTAVHHGPGQLARLDPLPEPAGGRYALFVGTLEPRKGVAMVLEAWRQARADGFDPPPLRLVGRWGWKSEDVRRTAEAARAEGWCEPLGYVDAPRLAGLYRGARVVVLPSLYEGFGLPLLEAMFVGVPILASDLPVTREVAGDAALYLPTNDPAAWAEALRRLDTEPGLAARLGEAGKRRAATFRWSEAARRTVAVLSHATGASAGSGAGR